MIRMRAAAAMLGLVMIPTAALSPPAGADAGHQRVGEFVVSREAGVLPEGIGLGPDRRTFYVTSSATGAIYRGRLGRPAMRTFVAGGSAGRHAAYGVHTDRAGRVYVAGATALDVYSPAGRLLAHRPAPGGPVGPASLNDLVIDRDAVYVTDFANPVVLRASLRHGRVGPLRPWLDVSTVQTALPAQFWFLNGIVLSSDRRTLVVSSQGLEQLLRVDIGTRRAEQVDLGDATFAADGLELRGRTVIAVLNYDPPNGQGVYVARLDRALRHGHVVAEASATDTGLDSPTTLALTGGRVLVVNSQLDHPPGTPPYTVSALDRRDFASYPG